MHNVPAIVARGVSRLPCPLHRSMKSLIICAGTLMFHCASHGAALIIGGFDSARAGTASITQGPVTEELRAAITADYPGSTFTGAQTLTAAYLATVDYLIVGAPTLSSPVFLSAPEQTALLNYVTAGGGAIIFIDNDTYPSAPAADDSNETFLDPFGVDSTGRVPSASNATSTAPNHPVMSGAAGIVTTFATNFGGWFDSLGSHGMALGQYDQNAQAALAVIAPGALAPGSGGVVFIGDADSLVDTGDGGLFSSADNATFFRNAVAYSVPEPSTIALLAGTALLLSRRKACRH